MTEYRATPEFTNRLLAYSNEEMIVEDSPRPSAAERNRAERIVQTLREMYPGAACSLNFTTPLELLVATMLSAQCTDERVNLVTQSLFKKYRSADDYANANLEELEQDIKQTGFYRNKAKHIRETARLIVERYGGETPHAMDELIALPGVARKTANVVMGNAFGIVEGVVVDTHVSRISKRLGLTDSDDPAKIEQDLMALLPKQDWLDFSHMVILHGRAVCQARKPQCAECALLPLCPTGKTELGGDSESRTATQTTRKRAARN